GHHDAEAALAPGRQGLAQTRALPKVLGLKARGPPQNSGGGERGVIAMASAYNTCAHRRGAVGGSKAMLVAVGTSSYRSSRRFGPTPTLAEEGRSFLMTVAR